MKKEAQPCCIGICGPTKSGKSTLAALLEQRHGYSREPFAQFLKSMLRTFLHDQGCPTTVAESMLNGHMKEVETIYFHYNTARHAMQTLGTEWRNMLHQALWTSAWERKIETSPKKKIVVEDLRFLHEESAIRRQPRSFIIRLERPGHTTGQHISEAEYMHIRPDWILVNAKTPEDLLRELGDRIGL